MRAKLIIKSYLKINRVSRTVRCFRFKPHAFSQRIIFLRLNPACPFRSFRTYTLYIPYFASSIAPCKDRRRVSQKLFSRYRVFPPLCFPPFFPLSGRRNSAPTMELHGLEGGRMGHGNRGTKQTRKREMKKKRKTEGEDGRFF